MAILIEFVNLIIPIEKINQSNLEGGFDTIKKEYDHLIGKAVWFDKYLFRMGWMDTWMLDGKINFWKKSGLVPSEKINGKEYWKDMIVISTGLDRFITNCDWIETDLSRRVVWLKGTDPNDIYPNQNFASYNVRDEI